MRVDAKWLGLLAGAALSAAALPVFSAEEKPAVNVTRLEQRVQRLENILDSGQLAQLIQKVNSLEQDIRNLRGQIENQSHRVDELRKRQRNLYSDLDRRLRDLEVAQKNAPSASGGGQGESSGSSGSAAGNAAGSMASAGAAAGAAAAGSAGDAGNAGSSAQQQASASESGGGGQGGKEDERKAYDAAFELLKDGRYDDAAKAFRTFLQNHPEGPYADNAQYWLGESYYVTRDFDKALEAFRGVSEKYPDSAKLPDARLKMGYTLYELDRMDEAKTILQKVMKEYANSAVARLAEDRLVRMKREQGSGSSAN